MGFSRQECWSGLPFPSPVDHILLELSTMTRPSWVALQGMAHSFIELDEAVVHVIRLVSFLWLWFSVCLPSLMKDKRLMEASWRERLRGKLGLVLMGGAMLSKSLIQFSVEGLRFTLCVLKFCRFWHVHPVMYAVLQYHTEQFHCSKNPPCFTYSSLHRPKPWQPTGICLFWNVM